MPRPNVDVSVLEFTHLEKTMYHGTNSQHYPSLFNGVSLRECKKRTDFGKGFYLTTKFEQASKHARNRSGFSGEPIVFVYDVNVEALAEYHEKIFRKMDMEWAEFVYFNRSKRHPYIHNYDYVFGGVADGKMDDLIEAMDKRHITPNGPDLKYFYQSIAKYDYNQLSIHNQDIFAYNIIRLKKVVRAFRENVVYEYDASQITS